MLYTIPEVKNPEEVHFKPGNSKLQCTGGPAVVGKFFAVHQASHLVYRGPALMPATTFLPPPWEYQCTGAGGILQAPVLVHFTSTRAQQYSGILLSAALS